MLFRKFTYQILNTLLPPTCVMCGYYTHNYSNICTDCVSDLPAMPPHCIQCGQFLFDIKTKRCGSCIKTPPDFDLTYALFPYKWPIIPMIFKLKFQHQLSFAQILGELLVKKIKLDWYATQPLPDCIVPVPLHLNRIQERGFNQVTEIARPIIKALRLNIDDQGLCRIKAGASQRSLSAAKRRRNIANAFITSRNYKGLHIALLDDVITTGSTIQECSRILKLSGAKQIDVWCCARRG